MYTEDNALVATGDDRKLNLELTGKIDLYYSIHLVESCYLSARAGRQTIVITLRNINYIDTEALGFLKDSLDVLRWHTGRIRLVTTETWVMERLRDAGLAKVCAVEIAGISSRGEHRGIWQSILQYLNPSRLLGRLAETPRAL